MEDTNKQKYRELIEAAADRDLRAFYHCFSDLMIEGIERKIRERAFSQGFLFEPGVTFTSDESESEVLFDLKK